MSRSKSWRKIPRHKTPKWVKRYIPGCKAGVSNEVNRNTLYVKGRYYTYKIVAAFNDDGGIGVRIYRRKRSKKTKMHKLIKKKPSYKKEREMKIKRAIKRAIATLTILAILAVAGYFLYPAFQSGEIQSSFQSVGENIGGWWNESGNYSPPATLSKPEINISELEKQIHDLINEEREKRGLPALAWNDKLNIIARKHSQDMANRNYFAHSDPEGHDFSYRYRQEGFNCEVRVGNYIYMGAENIFQNNLYSSVTYYGGVPSYDWNTQEEIAESTVQGWMNSPGHRQNILTAYWESEGIGVAISDDDKVYITEDFC